MANPPWSRDELIVTLAFYVKYSPSIPQKGSTEIEELSNTLVQLQRKLGGATPEKFRNQNGVYMKLMNFRRLDPLYEGVGLRRGNRLEPIVWDDFASSPEELKQTADAIWANAKSKETVSVPTESTDEVAEAREGRLLTIVHRHRERDSGLTRLKKNEALKASGKLTCEACRFDFADAYGERGDGFIECHHTVPLSELSPKGSTTTLSDLALLCSNCHRMIHRKSPWLTVGQLRDLLAN